MKKKIYKCSVCGDIHVGAVGPEICPTCQTKTSYSAATKADAESLAGNLGGKKLWRCRVCGDLHMGKGWPKKCPTCHTVDSYVEITEKEFGVALTSY